ncbi:acyltransferase family protein [Streptomyces sp. NPDC051320]|uniref:acyltransferase family protein n=1 Tax=Streptomyces sp. NPDC051320 TaxID=3154644 RepID=UPI0034323BF4
MSASVPPKPKSSARDPYFDNAKYLAIILVAAGHSWEPLPDSGRIVAAVYAFVYTFHMPVFILISGYLSRNFDLRPDRAWRLVTTLLVPYAVFEVAYTLFERVLRDSSFPLSPADPYWLLWFLPALFLWRLTTPIWQALRWPVPVSLGIAVVGAMGHGIGGDLQLERVLQFLPFYVLGMRLRPHHFELLRTTRVRLAAIPVCAVALLAAYWTEPRMNHAWFFRSSNAQDLGAPFWVGGIMTLALFGCALVLGGCFFAWVPGRRLWITALGAGTLYGYLLHGFVIRGANYLGWYDDLEFLGTPLGRVAVTLSAIAVVTLLCTPPVRQVFRFVVEPPLGWAARRNGTEGPARA